MSEFIKIPREIQDEPFWQIKPFDKGRAWIDLIILANDNGDIDITLRNLAKKWGWDRRTVKGFLEALEQGKKLSIKYTKVGTAITIKNYEEYIGCTTQCTTSCTTLCTTLDSTKPVDTQGVCERGKTNDVPPNVPPNVPRDVPREKKFSLSPTPPISFKKDIYTPPVAKATDPPRSVAAIIKSQPQELQPILNEFKEFREKAKSPLTSNAITRLIAKAKRLAGGRQEDVAKIFEQSIDRGWRGVFALETDERSRNDKTRNRGQASGNKKPYYTFD